MFWQTQQSIHHVSSKKKKKRQSEPANNFIHFFKMRCACFPEKDLEIGLFYYHITAICNETSLAAVACPL